MSARPSVAIVGATGAVGQEFLRLFEQRHFAHGELRLLASARSAGTTTSYRGQPHPISELTEDALQDIDIALFSAGGSISKAYGPVAAAAGATVIDNSSAFRMAANVPLVVPEINGDLAAAFRGDDGGRRPGIIANPNCSTIIMMVPLHQVWKRFGIERLVVSTYQAVSGAGAAAMRELELQTRDLLDGRDPTCDVFDRQCAFNVFSHNSKVDPDTGRNVEEQKMIDETRKIWGDDHIRVTATCIRVPVMRAHAEAINVTLKRDVTEAEFRAALAETEGIRLVDDRAANDFPTPLEASGRDEVLVGRIRPDASMPHSGEGRWRAFDLFVCGDQIRKGAALNAIQIAEQVVGA
ncbi:MAG: aspartate-semialdehyde dehydrogenase [Phycisphaerales bacterium]|nr:aspartate-semialdehyde dehydrogenase [Phycisphaerales bacterium]